ncbi:MAG: hypothetical protein ACREYF_25940 [Gammaproteobacteria bacterium]
MRVTVIVKADKNLEAGVMPSEHVELTLQSNGNSTNDTWAMHIPNPYIAKLVGISVNMDRMIGEEGLAKLRTVKE